MSIHRPGVERDPRDNASAVKFADTFSRFVNGDRTSVGDAAAICLRDHRTLQQGMMRFCIAFIDGMRKNGDNGVFDLRNEASVVAAQKMSAALSVDDRILPLI
jgi:hypothetical protein